jgi:hypothetical protein
MRDGGHRSATHTLNNLPPAGGFSMIFYEMAVVNAVDANDHVRKRQTIRLVANAWCCGVVSLERLFVC